MNVADFKIGRTYIVTTKAWETPEGTVVPGKTMTIKVLPAQEYAEAVAFDGVDRVVASPQEVEARKEFLRVKHPDGRTRLLHPETIESACAAGARV